MRTLGARLALWYSLVSTVTLFGLLAAGYFLLNRHLERGVDLQNAAEFHRLIANGSLPQPGAESPGFLVEVRDARGAVLYRSAALGVTVLPEAGKTVTIGALGRHRVGVFQKDGATVKVAVALEPVRQVMLGYAEISLVLICLVLLISLISGLALSRAALRPVRAIQETANRIRLDNLSERIPVGDSQDEIASLAELLNEMFDRLETAFAEVRRFSAEASHELKTPLSLLRLQAEKLLNDGRLGAEQDEAVQEQLTEINRMQHIIEDLLFLSRAEAQAIKPRLVRRNPREFLGELTEDAALLAEQAGVQFRAQIAPEGEAAFDAQWMRQALLNLLTNAFRYSGRGSLVTLGSEFTLDAWRLTVEDEGPGVPEADRSRIFERFVRLDDAAERGTGSGLGLAICRSVLAMHGGTIQAEAGKRKSGLRVVCEIPLGGAPRTMDRLPEREQAAD
ncbi:two-component sensor histidine kinase [Spartobacteria bacterium LR76]|nr:two-component sensor histidine kinase [Spartobacteria bacterium LR76]